MDSNLKEMYRIRTECLLKHEDTLYYYCVCLLKLRRACQKIKSTEMLAYIRQIVAPSFPLVEKYFLSRADAYLRSSIQNDKYIILKDIELSVETFCEVCETVIQSTNVADRMLIQSAPMELGIRQVSVKECAYCSSMLNDLALIFQEDKSEREYAFSVYPSLGSIPETVLLFGTLPERGKVGIIRAPGKDIAHIQYLRMLISHEFFHIVPGSILRHRYERAKKLGTIILYDLRIKLFQGIDYLTINQKKRFEDFIFKGIPEQINKCFLDADKDDRRYYSKNTCEFYGNFLMNKVRDFMNISLEEMFQYVFEPDGVSSLNVYKKYREQARRCLEDLNNNIVEAFMHSSIQKLCKFHSEIFREVFADIMYVMTLRVMPDAYCSTFNYNPSGTQDERNRPDLYLRVGLVFAAMSDYAVKANAGDTLFQSWRNWLWGIASETGGDHFRFIEGVKRCIRVFQGTPSDPTPQKAEYYILPDRNIWEQYKEYVALCRDQYLVFEKNNKKKFSDFREKYSIETNSNMELLSAISVRKWEGGE